MRAVSVAVGVVIVLVTMRDVVHELFDPESTGSMSAFVMRHTWRLVRFVARRWRDALYGAGPLVLIAVATMWTSLVTLGCALVYLPFLPSGFQVDPALPSEAGRGFGTALYISLSSLTTLNASAIAPRDGWLRFAAAMESLLGMVMITAWISWVISIYPVLSRRRSFEREVRLLAQRHERPDEAVRRTSGDSLEQLLQSLTEQVLTVDSELGQSRVSYYFQNRTPEISLANQLPYVLALGRAARSSAQGEGPRLRSELLERATIDLLRTVGREFLDLRDATPEQAIAALAEDQMLERR